LDSLCTLLVIGVHIVLLDLLLVLRAIAVSSLLLFDLEFDFIDFLLSIWVPVVASLARRNRHDTY
jgi:hypothetical protein